MRGALAPFSLMSASSGTGRAHRCECETRLQQPAGLHRGRARLSQEHRHQPFEGTLVSVSPDFWGRVCGTPQQFRLINHSCFNHSPCSFPQMPCLVSANTRFGPPASLVLFLFLGGLQECRFRRARPVVCLILVLSSRFVSSFSHDRIQVECFSEGTQSMPVCPVSGCTKLGHEGGVCVPSPCSAVVSSL